MRLAICVSILYHLYFYLDDMRIEKPKEMHQHRLILLRAIVDRVFLIVDKSIIGLRFSIFPFALLGFCRRISFPSVMFFVGFFSFTISLSSSVKADIYIYMVDADLICYALMLSRPHAFPFFRHDIAVLTSSSVTFVWLLLVGGVKVLLAIGCLYFEWKYLNNFCFDFGAYYYFSVSAFGYWFHILFHM